MLHASSVSAGRWSGMRNAPSITFSTLVTIAGATLAPSERNCQARRLRGLGGIRSSGNSGMNQNRHS